MGIIAWIILGGLAGWIASILIGRNREMGCLANIVAGVLGALVGGLVMNLVGRGQPLAFSLRSLLVAILGAVIVLAITGWWRRR
jgi:uncharacterized membrane protein YeaQ/YmgE (transglycosylase-associated protein family)